MYCDRLYAVKDGRVVGQGSPEELLTPEFIREVYEVDAQIMTGMDGALHILFHPGAVRNKKREIF
jgi:iron complex transport system ATP-binding protein